jgi:four helix bundle protein
MATPAAGITSPEKLRDRTKAFASRIIRLFRALPKKTEAQVIGRQLLRAGTSVGANYRAVMSRTLAAGVHFQARNCRGGSRRNHLLAGVAGGKRCRAAAQAGRHLKEARELTAIFTAAVDTSRSNE